MTKKNRGAGRQQFSIKRKKPSRGQQEDNEIENLSSKYNNINSSQIKSFSDFPLSHKTFKGLEEYNYKIPTDIQLESIGFSLKGHDILGAAKTGSGKTLAFIIPLLEKLFSMKWGRQDGMGALIISPTRELAYQTFEVLRKVGRYHDFSAGLVTGGKFVKEEAERIHSTNIVVCTPGRLLQHMDQTPYFNADNLLILVLDEADRILDLGFQQTMNAIIENLPVDRQTLLFSATQTRSVKELARLSLKDPMYISVHQHAEKSTPDQLQQSYLECELHQKVDFLWSFIKHHLKKKTIVFMSSCKQVRFIYESFCKLRPGVSLLVLHGAMSQEKRMENYKKFVWKQHVVLFATDLAARGLDFPSVNWVLQLDCPDSAETYIHRAGRTARFEKDGETLLVLMPSESDGMLKQLEAKRIPVERIDANPKKLHSIQGKMESLLAADPKLKEYAQRACVSYFKSVFLMSNKEIFDAHKLDSDQYARSIGLAIPPRIRFLQRDKKKREQKIKTVENDFSYKLKKVIENDENEDSADSQTSVDDDPEYKSTVSDNKEAFNFEINGVGNDFLSVKNKAEKINCESSSSEELDSDQETKKGKKKSKIATAKKLLRKNIQLNSVTNFDEEGKELIDPNKKTKPIIEDDLEVLGLDIKNAKERMRLEDAKDKKLYREKIKKKHKEEKQIEKQRKREKREMEKERFKYNKQNQDESESDSEADVRLASPEHSEEGSTTSDVDQMSLSDDESASESGSEEAETSDEESDKEYPPPKRKRFQHEKHQSEDESGSSSEELEKESIDGVQMTLADKEAVALKLLQS